MRLLVPIVALLMLASVAYAQPDNRAKAKAAFARAVQAEERQDWRTAVDEYLNAYELAPHPDVLFNVATVYERMSELRQAATYYGRYLKDAPDAPDRAKVERTIDGLRKKPSPVTIESAPAGAVIIVDGERKGRAPIELKLPGGEHHIVAEHGGTMTQRRVTVEYAEPVVITLAVGGNGTLVVTSNEAGAVVRLDGNQVGVTPFTGVVAPGRHTVVVEKPGFTTVERVVDVPPDGTAQISAGMVRPLGYIEPTTPARNVGVILGGGTGSALVEGTPVTFDFTFGWRSAGRRGDLYTGVAFGGGGVGYALGARLYVLTGRVRPYVGGGRVAHHQQQQRARRRWRADRRPGQRAHGVGRPRRGRCRVGAGREHRAGQRPVRLRRARLAPPRAGTTAAAVGVVDPVPVPVPVPDPVRGR